MKSSATEVTLSVGQVAQRFGLATHVLRHWESQGLVSPARDAAGRRRYATTDLYRVAAVLRAKEAGLGLEAIAGLIGAGGPRRRREVLEAHHAELSRCIDRLEECRKLVACALDCDQQDLMECPHFQARLQAEATPPPTCPST